MLHIFLARCMNGLLLTWWKAVTLIVVSGFSFRGRLIKIKLCLFGWLKGLLGTQYIAFLCKPFLGIQQCFLLAEKQAAKMPAMYKFTSHVIPVEVRKQISVSEQNLAGCPWAGLFSEAKMGWFYYLLMIFFKEFSKNICLESKKESTAVPGMIIHREAVTIKSVQVLKSFRKMEGGQHRMLLLEMLCKAEFREGLVQFCCHTKFPNSLSALSALFLRDKMYIP